MKNERNFGPIPDKFKYPIPEDHKLNKDREGGGHRHSKTQRRKEEETGDRRPPVSYKERRRGPGRARATLDSALRRRTSQPAGGRRSDEGGEKIDGLDLSFWVEDVDLETSSPKPDYRDRWRNLTRAGGSNNNSSAVGDSRSDNNSNNNNRARVSLKKLSNSSAVGGRRSDSDSSNTRTRVGESLKQHSSEQVTVFGDWGDTLWEEVEQEWGEAGGWHHHQDQEDRLASLSARYLHAWADVARIGARAKTTPAPVPAPAPAPAKVATEEAEDSAAAGSVAVASSAETVGPGPLWTPAPARLNNYRRRPIKRTRL